MDSVTQASHVRNIMGTYQRTSPKQVFIDDIDDVKFLLATFIAL